MDGYTTVAAVKAAVGRRDPSPAGITAASAAIDAAALTPPPAWHLTTPGAFHPPADRITVAYTTTISADG